MNVKQAEKQPDWILSAIDAVVPATDAVEEDCLCRALFTG